jgi:hypothetical protein
MNVLINEYRAWRDEIIPEIFEKFRPENAEDLCGHVCDNSDTFHDEYKDKITFQQYKTLLIDLLNNNCLDAEYMIEKPLIQWACCAAGLDDWEALYQANKPLDKN